MEETNIKAPEEIQDQTFTNVLNAKDKKKSSIASAILLGLILIISFISLTVMINQSEPKNGNIKFNL